MTLEKLIPILQMAIGPVILISGVGMLLLVMTNRLARTIDRARLMVVILRQCDEAEHVRSQAQLHILWQRATLLQSAIFKTAMSALLAALLVILVFVSALMECQIGWLISIIFMGSMLGIVGGLVSFLRDVNYRFMRLRLRRRTHHMVGAKGISIDLREINRFGSFLL